MSQENQYNVGDLVIVIGTNKNRSDDGEVDFNHRVMDQFIGSLCEISYIYKSIHYRLRTIDKNGKEFDRNINRFIWASEWLTPAVKIKSDDVYRLLL